MESRTKVHLETYNSHEASSLLQLLIFGASHRSEVHRISAKSTIVPGSEHIFCHQSPRDHWKHTAVCAETGCKISLTFKNWKSHFPDLCNAFDKKYQRSGTKDKRKLGVWLRLVLTVRSTVERIFHVDMLWTLNFTLYKMFMFKNNTSKFVLTGDKHRNIWDCRAQYWYNTVLVSVSRSCKRGVLLKNSYRSENIPIPKALASFLARWKKGPSWELN